MNTEDFSMPRGRKKASTFTLEEQLANIQVEIDNHTEALKKLKTQKKEIQDKIAEKEKDEVYRAFLKSGKSLEDIISILSETGSEENAEN